MIVQSFLAQFSDTVKGNNAIAGIALRLPINLTADWQEKINNYPFWKGQPLAWMVADMAMMGFQQLSEPLEKLQYIAWKSADDEPVLKALAQATIGKIIERSMLSGEPTQEPITASYTTAPQLALQVDQTQLESSLPQQIKKNLFPDSSWSNEEERHMNMELDPVDVPNAVLATGEIEVLRINTLDGRDAHHPTENSIVSSV
ncbi:MAG: hypothetical protein ABIJ59_01755 [Pseudomonadota bacterium]